MAKPSVWSLCAVMTGFGSGACAVDPIEEDRDTQVEVYDDAEGEVASHEDKSASKSGLGPGQRQVVKVRTVRVDDANEIDFDRLKAHVEGCSRGRIKVEFDRALQTPSKRQTPMQIAQRVLGEWSNLPYEGVVALCLPKSFDKQISALGRAAVGFWGSGTGQFVPGRWFWVKGTVCGQDLSRNTNALAHELLHTRGLGHSTKSGPNLMRPTANTLENRRECPSPGDQGWPEDGPSFLRGR